MSIRGWVYIIDNEAMPDILKIGFSTKDPIFRARELAGTGIPHHFRVLFDVLVENPRSVEQAVHAMLALKREGKEWFRCTQEEAITAIRVCAKTVFVERNNPKVFQSLHGEKDTNQELTKCWYYGCSKLGTLSHKENQYCEEHHKMLRKQRFDYARLIQNG